MKCLRPLTVDAILPIEGKLVLIRRSNEPFKGMHALPGGFVEVDETTDAAVIREVREETGLEAEIDRIVGVYSDPDRDPRGPVVSICYLLKVTGGTLRASSDAAAIALCPLDQLPDLAFDHGAMVSDALVFLPR